MKQMMVQKIVDDVNNKGWNFYSRQGIDRRLSVSKTVQKGPTCLLKERVLYMVLPNVGNPTDKKEIKIFIIKHKVMPTITMPTRGFSHLGRLLVKFSRGYEESSLDRGEEVQFVGIQLCKKVINLLASPSSKIVMPYRVFAKALDSLQDITGLDSN